MEVFCEHYNIAIGCMPMLCAARALSHLVYIITRMSHSLPAHHAHVSERAKRA